MKKQNYFKNIFGILGNSLKQDFEAKTPKFKDMAIHMLVVSVLMLASIFQKYFVLGSVIYLGILVLIDRKLTGLYYIVFAIPLINLMYLTHGSFNFLSLIVVEFILICIIRFIKDVVNGRKKINIFRTILLGLILVIYVLQLNKNNLTITFGITSGILLVYFVGYYFEELDLKEIIYCFVLGIIIAIIIGLFRPISSRLISFSYQYYANGLKRFAGVSNPNFLAGQMMIALGMLYLLVLLEKIKVIFYPIFFTFFITLIFTMSKSGLINFCVISVLFILIYLIKNFKKIKILKIAVVGILSLTIFLSMGFITKPYINRFISVFDNLRVESSDLNNTGTSNENIEFDNDSSDLGSDVMSDLTTGRSVLWKNYIKKISKTPKTLLFGYGIGAEETEENGLGLKTSAHNTFIQILYYNGIVGLFLIAAFLISCLKNKKIFRKSVLAIVPLTAIALYMCCDNIYNYTLFSILAIMVLYYNMDHEENVNMSEELFKGREVIKIGIKELSNIKIAIVTPTYNRAHLLDRCFESLHKQTDKHFVWYIIDDGSSDETENIVNKYIENNKDENCFKIVYIKKNNGGKHTALNKALENIKEDYVLILDSDDLLSNDAVETIRKDLRFIHELDEFCGLGYLRFDLEGKIIGRKYTKDGIEDTFINQRYNKNTFGDKCEVFKTKILKEFPFPEIEGERFLSEATVWCDMSGMYKMKFFNKGIYICDYQTDGLSDGVNKRLFINPQGAALCYKQLSRREIKFKCRLKYTIAYIVYSIASGKKLREMMQDYLSNKILLVMCYLPALMYFKKLKRRYR